MNCCFIIEPHHIHTQQQPTKLNFIIAPPFYCCLFHESKTYSNKSTNSHSDEFNFRVIVVMQTLGKKNMRCFSILAVIKCIYIYDG